MNSQTLKLNLFPEKVKKDMTQIPFILELAWNRVHITPVGDHVKNFSKLQQEIEIDPDQEELQIEMKNICKEMIKQGADEQTIASLLNAHYKWVKKL